MIRTRSRRVVAAQRNGHRWGGIKSSLAHRPPLISVCSTSVPSMDGDRSPTVIYLPSSGGRAGSRIASEVSFTNIEPEEPDLTTGSLLPAGSFRFVATVSRKMEVCRSGLRTRIAMCECFLSSKLALIVRAISRRRPRPYVKPAVRFTTPSSHHPSPSPEYDSTTATHGRNSTAELLKNLIPALVEDPAGFEASISSICAAHDIDRSVISAVTQAAKRKSSLNPLER